MRDSVVCCHCFQKRVFLAGRGERESEEWRSEEKTAGIYSV